MTFGPESTQLDRVFVLDPAINRIRAERHYGDRVLRCFEKRPAGLDSMIRSASASRPNEEAIVCGERRITWHEFDHLVGNVAANLRSHGLSVGDRVAVMLDNRLEFFLSVFGIIRAGAIAVPLGTRLGPGEVGYISAHAGVSALITCDEWWQRIHAVLPENLLTYIVDAKSTEQTLFKFEALVKDTSHLPAIIENEDATALILYTSGTTGKPKGACITHLAFSHSALHYIYALELNHPQRGLLAIPGSHIAGFMALATTTIATGGTLILEREFKAPKTLALMERESVTYTVFVPAMFQLCLADPSFNPKKLSAWQTVVYGGAIMPPAVVEDAARRLPNLHLVNAYGSTETCAPATIMPFDATAGRTASIGLTVHCGDVIVVDERGCEVPRGTSGELWIAGPMVSPGYWQDDLATKNNFTGGYWMSGDIGTMDAEGFVTIHDRKKDMIVRGGYKVFSAEVENAIIAFGDIQECAVVPVPCPVLGERVFAFVNPTKTDFRLDSLRDWLASQIADYKCPDFYHISNEPLARNQNGKMQKGILREIALKVQGNA